MTATARAGLRTALEAGWVLPAVLALTAALRIPALFLPLEQSSDFLWYFLRAQGIAAGQGYSENGVPTAFWPVGWPGALGLLFRLTGPSALAGQVLNLLMAVAVGFLAARLARRVSGRVAVGNGAALILAVLPNQIGYVPLLSAEIFFELLLLASLALVMGGGPVRLLFAGLVFGVMTLTKAQSLVLPAVLLSWVYLAAPGRPALRRTLVALVLCYAGLLAVVAPWTYRNWTVLHAFVPVSTNGGWTLLTGNNPQANGDYVTETPLADGISHDPANQVEADRTARARAAAWIKANPGRFVALMPLKAFRLWAPDGESEWFYQRGFAGYDAHWQAFRTLRWLNQALYLLVLLAAVPAMYAVLRRWPSPAPYAHWGIALFAVFTLVSLVFSGQSRFHMALMPFVAAYASATLVGGWRDKR